MGIYNYLFYKSFVLAKKSKNYDDCPVLGGMIWVIMCVGLNIGTILLFIGGLGMKSGLDFLPKYKVVFGLGYLGLLLFYYLYKGRYKKIVAYYESKKDKSMKIHPAIVIFFYYIVSFGLALLAALFKNKAGIFAQ